MDSVDKVREVLAFIKFIIKNLTIENMLIFISSTTILLMYSYMYYVICMLQIICYNKYNKTSQNKYAQLCCYNMPNFVPSFLSLSQLAI